MGLVVVKLHFIHASKHTIMAFPMIDKPALHIKREGHRDLTHFLARGCIRLSYKHNPVTAHITAERRSIVIVGTYRLIWCLYERVFQTPDVVGLIIGKRSSHASSGGY